MEQKHKHFLYTSLMVQTINDLGMLLGVIRLLPDSIHPSIIVVSGFGGSGKTTLAHTLASHLEEAAVITTDDFMLPSYTERSEEWDCVDRKRIIEQIMKPSTLHEDVRYQVFDWETHALGEWRTIGRPKYIILEGIGLMHPDLTPYLHFSIWINCSPETAMQRGINRDKKVLHVDQAKLWQEIWMPNDQDFYEKFRPDESADCLYEGS
jgi:uridine kinase